MFNDVLPLKGRQHAGPGGSTLGFHCEKRASSTFAVQCGLQNDDSVVAPVELAELFGGPILWLNQHARPAAPVNVFAQGSAVMLSKAPI
ncbi:hypothetical protein SBA1_610018 [Candidatus Sulfotelmatobacter kueseliae]|uniref:Uncharacterized protein n=1 Tax=Candidatus Sulfotelmatobacter kueseliae TaxID=2042962 RepID=A0A2U3L1X0_9BACT|nr:hypothetical protein SBA1_610018 [Candidatus Sulfotelmatobacter kueseliae]